LTYWVSVYDGHGVDGVDEQIVVDGAVPGDVRDAVQCRRQEEVDVDTHSMLSAQFSTAPAYIYTVVCADSDLGWYMAPRISSAPLAP